jgi:hypothetical protein
MSAAEITAEHMHSPSEQDQLIPETPVSNVVPNQSNVRVFSLLLKALFALIVRLWIATLSISMIMYFLRRIPVNPILHHSGRIINEKPVVLSWGKDMEWTATPALFGAIINEEIRGIILLIRSHQVH